VLVVPLDPRHEHGQQDQVREDDDGDADAGGHGHLLHDLHRISRMVMKPTRSASSAMIAGISSCRNVWRAASMLPTPATAASLTALIFCTPCETPIAKIRNGTS